MRTPTAYTPTCDDGDDVQRWQGPKNPESHVQDVVPRMWLYGFA